MYLYMHAYTSIAISISVLPFSKFHCSHSHLRHIFLPDAYLIRLLCLTNMYNELNIETNFRLKRSKNDEMTWTLILKLNSARERFSHIKKRKKKQTKKNSKPKHTHFVGVITTFDLMFKMLMYG